MNHASDISIEQLARLARDAGALAKIDVSEPVRKVINYGRRHTDVGYTPSVLEKNQGRLESWLNGLRF